MVKLGIDAGHGMGNKKPGVYDGGAESHGVHEADMTLAYALAVKFVFKQAGIDVFLTRDESSDVTPVGHRNEQAEQAGCTHFIAIHMNDGGGTGTECYYRGRNGSPAKDWASRVLGCALRAFGLKDRGLKDEGASQHTSLAVLDFKGPACLVELGFIDSDRDRVLLSSRDSRVKFAEELLTVWRNVMKE